MFRREYPRIKFSFPQHFQRLVLCVVIDAAQTNEGRISWVDGRNRLLYEVQMLTRHLRFAPQSGLSHYSFDIQVPNYNYTANVESLSLAQLPIWGRDSFSQEENWIRFQGSVSP